MEQRTIQITIESYVNSVSEDDLIAWVKTKLMTDEPYGVTAVRINGEDVDA